MVDHKIGNLLSEPCCSREFESLFCGRFETLRQYFENIYDSDLTTLSKDDLIKVANAHDKLLMSVFVDSKLSPFMDQSIIPHQNEEPAEVCVVSLVSDVVGRFLLINLRKKLFSSKSPSKYLTEKIKISQVGNIVVDCIHHIETTNKLTIIDFSENFLIDSDLFFIKDVIQTLPNIPTIIRLRTNNFYQADTILMDLIHMDVVQFIDLSMNPFASYDRRDFFATDNVELRTLINRKVIFIPRLWMEKKSWRKLVPVDSVHQILTCHNEYYCIMRCVGLL